MDLLISNLTFTAAIVGLPWILVVAWTLAIEVQFYLAVVFLLPTLLARPALRVAAILVWMALPLVLPNTLYLPAFAALFGMGIASYLRTKNLIGTPVCAATLAVAAAVQAYRHDIPSALAGVATAVLIFSRPSENRVLSYLGMISYSLYLVHVPIGGRVANLGARLPPFPGRGIMVVLSAVAISVLAASIFHRVVEAPCIARSRRIGRQPFRC